MIDFHVAGLRVMIVPLPEAGKSVIDSHSHPYDHDMVLKRGAARITIWRDGRVIHRADHSAPYVIRVLAMDRHRVVALEPRTLIICVSEVKVSGGGV